MPDAVVSNGRTKAGYMYINSELDVDLVFIGRVMRIGTMPMPDIWTELFPRSSVL